MALLRTLGGVFLAAGMLLTGGSASAQTIRVNYIPIVDVAPLFVAIEKGFFKEEGITIVPTPSTGGAAGIPGLMAGAYDVMYGNIVSTVMAQQQGFKLEILAAGTKLDPEGAHTSGMVARAADGIKSGKDLEGKTVAVNTRNNVIWLYGRAWVAKTGGDPAKVTFKEVPFPQMTDALRGKQVDAAFMVDPFMAAAVAEKDTFSFVASPYLEVQPGVEIGHYITTQDYFNKNRDLVTKFNRAFRKGVIWFNNNMNDPELIQIIAGFSKMKPEMVAKLTPQARPEIIDPTSADKTIELMKANGLIATDVDVRAMIAPEALK